MVGVSYRKMQEGGGGKAFIKMSSTKICLPNFNATKITLSINQSLHKNFKEKKNL